MASSMTSTTATTSTSFAGAVARRGHQSRRRSSAWSTVDAVIERMRLGGMVVLVDDEDRENEGDVIVPAGRITTAQVNFLAMHARGLICLALAPERCDQLGLQQMVASPTEAYGTAFTVSIEAAEGVTTGISAADRAHTMRVASAANASPSDIVMPGHIFPLRARPAGVLERRGHTEASVDLARLAGLEPAAAICEVMNDDGEMARVPDLERFCEKFELPLLTIESLVEWRERRDA